MRCLLIYLFIYLSLLEFDNISKEEDGYFETSSLFNAHLSCQAVLSKEVGSTATDAGNNTRKCNALQVFAESSSALSLAKEGSSQTSNVRSGHRSAALGTGTVVRDITQDTNTWCENIDDGAVVGERGNDVIAIRGTDGAEGWFRCGGNSSSINGDAEDVAVACGSGGEVASVGQSLGSIVDGLSLATTERHADDDSVRAVPVRNVLNDLLHSSNHRSPVCG